MLKFIFLILESTLNIWQWKRFVKKNLFRTDSRKFREIYTSPTSRMRGCVSSPLAVAKVCSPSRVYARAASRARTRIYIWIYVLFAGCKLQTHVRADEDYDRDLTDQIVGEKSDVLSIEATKTVYHTRDNNAKFIIYLIRLFR